ncbi:PEP/pyruvate-binding domain-containing protein [Streptomyces neyagawaensis]|uniref:PEP/pyruvate-binding domain-containing protein n=1 Tax=Streptomyces neyagawaensis TaxID=42238 RepID=A0ABV3AUZ7_9ACTN
MTTVDERRGDHGEGAHGGRPPRSDGTSDGTPASVTSAFGSHVVSLTQPTASLRPLTGSKAAHLARAARAGLPVLPGFVLSPGFDGSAGPSARHGPRPAPEEVEVEDSIASVAVAQAWAELSRRGTRPLVVRSSSPQEDTEESSLAGRFDSVLDVRGWEEFRAAVRTVRDSARLPDGTDAPMAVLVQPMLRARVGGVLFGADPVAGRTDHMLVSAVRGGPDTLVSGEQPGTNYWLTGRGRLLRTEAPEPSPPGTSRAPFEPPSTATSPTAPAPAAPSALASPAPSAPGSPPHATASPNTTPSPTLTKRTADPTSLLNPSDLRRLARLARQAARVFGGPQDIEFGFDDDGRLWLFQSRPITAMATRPARGARLLGPGPVAETLPGRLEPLEEDLWLAPMARGLSIALDLGGSAPRRLLRTLPVVTTVGGRAAADLRLLGVVPPRHRLLALLNPATGARRLGAAWRVGRLASTLPGLATDLVADVDRRLTEIPAPSRLRAPALVSSLRWARAALVSLHAQEALAGAFLPAPRVTAASAALATLTEPWTQGLPDDRLIAAEPVLLTLTPPSLWEPSRLPRTAPTPRPPQGSSPNTGPDGPVDDHTARPPSGSVSAVDDHAVTLPSTATGLPLPSTTTGLDDHTVPPPYASVGALPPREALRLRIRWVQELQVRLVREAAHRLGVRGVPGGPRRVGLLRWKEFVAALEGGPLPRDLGERLPRPGSAPLPDAFRLTDDGVVVAEPSVRRSGDGGRGGGPGGGGAGRGVSAGWAVGAAWDGDGAGPEDAVLVVRTLDPAFAPLLPRLAGLVAQTGSPLSHLAVLAREYGVPTVVGAADAVRRFPPGTRLTVDGTLGDVRPEEPR